MYRGDLERVGPRRNEENTAHVGVFQRDLFHDGLQEQRQVRAGL